MAGTEWKQLHPFWMNSWQGEVRKIRAVQQSHHEAKKRQRKNIEPRYLKPKIQWKRSPSSNYSASLLKHKRVSYRTFSCRDGTWTRICNPLLDPSFHVALLPSRRPNPSQIPIHLRRLTNFLPIFPNRNLPSSTLHLDPLLRLNHQFTIILPSLISNLVFRKLDRKILDYLRGFDTYKGVIDRISFKYVTKRTANDQTDTGR